MNHALTMLFSCQVKTVRFLVTTLEEAGFRVAMLHGERSQPEREVLSGQRNCGTDVVFAHRLTSKTTSHQTVAPLGTSTVCYPRPSQMTQLIPGAHGSGAKDPSCRRPRCATSAAARPPLWWPPMSRHGACTSEACLSLSTTTSRRAWSHMCTVWGASGLRHALLRLSRTRIPQPLSLYADLVDNWHVYSMLIIQADTADANACRRTGRLASNGHAFSFFTRNLAPVAQPLIDLLQARARRLRLQMLDI